jgi:hypothetical protein
MVVKIAAVYLGYGSVAAGLGHFGMAGFDLFVSFMTVLVVAIGMKLKAAIAFIENTVTTVYTRISTSDCPCCPLSTAEIRLAAALQQNARQHAQIQNFRAEQAEQALGSVPLFQNVWNITNNYYNVVA